MIRESCTPDDCRRRRLGAFARLLARYLAADESARRSIDAIAAALAGMGRPERDAALDEMGELLGDA